MFHARRNHIFVVDCNAHSYALCKDKVALFYAQVHMSGAQLRFPIRKQKGAIVEKKQQAAQTSDSREMATSSTDRMAQTPPILLFTWRMCDILARMHARGYILQSAHTVAWALFLQCSLYNVR